MLHIVHLSGSVPGTGLYFNDVLLQAQYKGSDVSTLLLGYLQGFHCRPRVLQEPGPVVLADLQSRVRGLHIAAGVIHWASGTRT